jgi:Golgi SNAP receptor complex protein 2
MMAQLSKVCIRTQRDASLRDELGFMMLKTQLQLHSAVAGQISTTLTAFSRLIDDYSRQASSPNTPADKRERAQRRAQQFREEHTNLKNLFEKRKQEAAERSRQNLLGAGGSTSVNVGMGARGNLGPRLRPNAPPAPLGDSFSESPFASSSNNPNGMGMGNDARTEHALSEHTFIQRSENAIDDYLLQGKAVLDNLVEQREILRRSKRGLRGVGETLGLSRETIGWVERRT